MLAAASTSHSRLSGGGQSSPSGPVQASRRGPPGAVRGDQVGTGAGVEEQRRLRAPGALLQADHQLAHAGGRPPVDLPQVVAVAVLPGADVVLAVDGDRPAGALAAPALPARRPAGAERPDPGDDEQRRGVRADRAALDQPERVHQPQPQRAEHVPAPAVPVHPVVQRRGRPVRQPLHQEPGRAAEVAGQLLGQHPQPARTGVGVGDVQQDVGALAARHPGRRDRPPRTQPEALAGHRGRRQHRQRQHEDRELDEGPLAEQRADQQQDAAAGDQQRPRGVREESARPTGVATGLSARGEPARWTAVRRRPARRCGGPAPRPR